MKPRVGGLLAILALTSLAASAAPADKPAAKPAAKPADPKAPGAAPAPAAPLDEAKTIYALGVVISGNLKQFRLTPAEVEILKSGLTDGLAGKEKKEEVEKNGPRIQELLEKRQSAAAAEEKKASGSYLAKMAAEPGAQKKASGLVYRELKAGAGEQPKSNSKVKVHYHGTLSDGTVFDSSVQRGQPAEFPLDRVIPCWTEGVPLMKVGGKAKITCPSEIAYGDRGAPPTIKPGATLTFEVELLEIAK
ncbi:MAG: FKBP-type peptidyl-prolyl cis-trans isomerase [Acidobacteria bacterium]|nr:FKBP-type peptidyl-prolyl cis-trans isomerase [Acidobacteriota bacterium]